MGGIDQTYIDLHKSNPKLILVKKRKILVPMNNLLL